MVAISPRELSITVTPSGSDGSATVALTDFDGLANGFAYAVLIDFTSSHPNTTQVIITDSSFGDVEIVNCTKTTAGATSTHKAVLFPRLLEHEQDGTALETRTPHYCVNSQLQIEVANADNAHPLTVTIRLVGAEY